MKSRTLLLVVLCLSASVAFAAAIKGVTGGLTLVEKNAGNANEKTDITVEVGDKIEITWTYPITPGGTPTNVDSKSDAEGVVKPGDILTIVKPGILGAGIVGAFFKAEKTGKTTIYFNINDGGTGARLACDVTVK